MALASSCFPGESGEASAGDAPSATAVTAAASGKPVTLAQRDDTSDGPDGRYHQGKTTRTMKTKVWNLPGVVVRSRTKADAGG